MAQLSRSVATLRVADDDLIPGEVSDLLKATPSMAYARGDSIPSKRGVVRVARFGSWTYDGTETEPADVNAQVIGLLEQLSPDLDVWQELAARFKVDLFCGWFMDHENEGIVISPETLLALAQRHIKLSLDIYGCDEDRRGEA